MVRSKLIWLEADIVDKIYSDIINEYILRGIVGEAMSGDCSLEVGDSLEFFIITGN